MKSTLLLFTLLSFVYYIPGKAQNKSSDSKIESLKVAYISQKLDLTPKEAKNFWPIYNNYEKDMKKLLSERRKLKVNSSQVNKMDDSDANASIEQQLDSEEEVVALRKKYKQEFIKVLPPQKVMLLYQAERDFKNQLINELKDRNNNNKKLQ